MVRDALHLTGAATVATRIHGHAYDHGYVLIHGGINGFSDFRVEPCDSRRTAVEDGYGYSGRICTGIGQGFDGR